MCCAIAYPCIEAADNVLRTRRSSVPARIGERSDIVSRLWLSRLCIDETAYGREMSRVSRFQGGRSSPYQASSGRTVSLYGVDPRSLVLPKLTAGRGNSIEIRAANGSRAPRA